MTAGTQVSKTTKKGKDGSDYSTTKVRVGLPLGAGAGVSCGWDGPPGVSGVASKILPLDLSGVTKVFVKSTKFYFCSCPFLKKNLFYFTTKKF